MLATGRRASPHDLFDSKSFLAEKKMPGQIFL
jgi:hypothetical protein